MQCLQRTNFAGRTVVARKSYAAVQRRPLRCQARAGGAEEPFNETAAQVKRLISRDRQAFLGNAVDILDKYETEFGEQPTTAANAPPAPAAQPAAAPSTSAPAAGGTAASSAAPPATPFKQAAPAAVATKFGGSAAPASPFGASSGASTSPFGASSAGASPFGTGASPLSRRQSSEPKGLSPYMSPDPVVNPAGSGDKRNFLQRITLTQVVLFLSFSTIIGIMIATFFVVVNTGAVRLAGIE